MAAVCPNSNSSTVRYSDGDSRLNPHEQTPLLDGNHTSLNASDAETASSLKRPDVDAPHLLEAQLKDTVSHSPKDGARLTTAATVASVIPVMLLGANV